MPDINMKTRDSQHPSSLSRRDFVRGTMAALSLPLLATGAAAAEEPAVPPTFTRKIKLGVIGNGGRGAWIAKLFQKHGGYEMHAVADYFQDVADRCGDELGVDKARRFSTLSGYKRLIESGVEAVALETPPYFLPEHARAAVEAGLHVYMAKPVAVDTWGCFAIEAAAKLATRKQRCFLVDYQMPTDPANIEVVKRIREPGFGKIMHVATNAIYLGFPDPPKTATIESRLMKLIWVNDIALGGDYVVNFDIHAVDAVIWALGQRPVAASGAASIGRKEPHGDARDVCSAVFEYADGLVHNHFGQNLANQTTGETNCRIYGQTGRALLNYSGEANYRIFDDAYRGNVDNLYEAGAVRNIAAFYQNVTQGRCENETAARAVDGALACILAREAAARHTRLTMEQLLREKQRLQADLKGLKT
jgi:predicted dehydrogenase